MSTNFREFGETVGRLDDALAELERRSVLLSLPPLAGREWYDLLRQKLVPQLKDDAFLVVAVVGGTNIGKSVVFNHLAGCRASATSPLASGTKHPVCLVPPGFAQKHDLAAIFEGFELRRWSEASQALESHDEHMLFWRDSPETAENLLVLDTPDIDSDAPVNWQRADHVRRCADILIAILTQQKYNDAAVKQFFRRAAAEDKAVVIVFNQCLLPEDEAYWPLWLGTFCKETGVIPEIVYITPNDRRAAEDNRLPFYERAWPPATSSNGDGESTTSGNAATGAAPTPIKASVRSPAEDLSRFRFAEVKLRTLRGSLQHLMSADQGVPAYLREVQARTSEFRAAATRLSTESVVRVSDWPVLGSRLFVDEIRRWWRSQQPDWARKVNGVYDAIGRGVSWPFRFARERLQGEPPPPLDQYRKAEWTAILDAIHNVFEKLSWMAESGSDLLKPHFAQLLAGRSRQGLVDLLRTEHAAVPLETEIEAIVAREMNAFQQGSPDWYKFYKNLNSVGAAVRPVTSVVFFTLGFGPAGDVVAPVVADMATQAVIHVVAEVTGGTAAAVAGEQLVSQGVGQGAGLLQAKFQRLQSGFTEGRVEWLSKLLKTHLLGTLPEELAAAASIPQSEAYKSVQTLLTRLDRQLAALATVTSTPAT